MVAKRTPTALDIKKKKKKWIPILASKEFNNQEIGETFLEEAEHSLGRMIEVNLMMLTKDPKRQNFNVYFKINEIKNASAFTQLVGYGLQVAQLKKITKKAKNKIDDSFIYLTKDNAKIVLKLIIITKTLTYKTTLQLIRKFAREFLTGYTKANTATQIMQDVISNNLQRDLKNQVKKATPVVACMIKNAEILDEPKSN